MENELCIENNKRAVTNVEMSGVAVRKILGATYFERKLFFMSF